MNADVDGRGGPSGGTDGGADDGGTTAKIDAFLEGRRRSAEEAAIDGRPQPKKPSKLCAFEDCEKHRQAGGCGRYCLTHQKRAKNAAGGGADGSDDVSPKRSRLITEAEDKSSAAPAKESREVKCAAPPLRPRPAGSCCYGEECRRHRQSGLRGYCLTHRRRICKESGCNNCIQGDEDELCSKHAGNKFSNGEDETDKKRRREEVSTGELERIGALLGSRDPSAHIEFRRRIGAGEGEGETCSKTNSEDETDTRTSRKRRRSDGDNYGMPQQNERKETEQHVLADGATAGSGTANGLPVGDSEARTTEEDGHNDDDDHLLPPPVKPAKDGGTPFGHLRCCMCPNPSLCRSIVLRWLRLGMGEYCFFQNFPRPSGANTPVGRHTNAYRTASIRSLGYEIREGKIRRSVRVGFAGHGKGRTQECPVDKAFSGRLSVIHFHPEVRSYITDAKRVKDKADRWRVPVDLGERVGMGEEDRCPTPGGDGTASYFALPNFSLEQATAEVERAEEQYKEKAREFQEKNGQFLADMSDNPSKFAMRIHELEQQNAILTKENKDLKERARLDLSEKRAMEKHSGTLQKGLEKIARRMDKWESTQGLGSGISNRDARVIYREATGMDLGEEGFFDVDCLGLGKKYAKGTGHKRWHDPRMDRAVQAKWDDPTMDLGDALRIGGYEFPMLGQEGLKEKKTLDLEGVSLTKRKTELRHILRCKKDQMAKKAETDPEVAREYAERYPEVAPKLPFAGLDLSEIPDQPLVRSSTNRTGFRGVKTCKNGKFEATTGDGTNGGSKHLGRFDTLEEAARVYAKARYYLKVHGIPREWTEPPAACDDAVPDGDSDDDNDSNNHIEEETLQT